MMQWIGEQFDPSLDWDRVARIKELWGGKVILKGIIDKEDAKIAAQTGADAIIVSNHGGRQLDGAMTSIPVSYTHLRSPRDRTRSRMPSSA